VYHLRDVLTNDGGGFSMFQRHFNTPSKLSLPV